MYLKKYSLLLFGVVLVSGISAQKFKAGFSIGPVVTDIDGADNRDRDNDFHHLGISVGGILATRLNERTVFQFELNYVQKGSALPPDSLNNGFYKIALTYVELPLIFKRRLMFNLGKKKINMIDIEGGASVGELIRHVYTGSSNSTIPSNNDIFNYTDVSLLLGADYNFSENVFFCFRYTNSLIPAIKRNAPNSTNYTYTFNRGNNMVFLFSLKFLFSAVRK